MITEMLQQIVWNLFACNEKFVQYHTSLAFNHIILMFGLIEIVSVTIIKWFVLDETDLTQHFTT